MKKDKMVTIIGHFGGKKEFLDGQTVKTKILYEELNKNTKWKIMKVDTYYKKRPIKLAIQTLNAVAKSKDVIILLSGNGMKLYFPLLYFCSKIFNKNIYHDVIGGNLDYYIQKYPKYVKYLNEFKYNWVETNGLKHKLEILGIKNCEVIPNFKRLKIVSEDEIESVDSEKSIYKFCTFSRVMKEKGISDAIDAVNELNNEKYRGFLYQLDIYGPIDNNYEKEFKKKLKTSSNNNIRYCGKIAFNSSVEVLKQYDALLFPTYWDGEGFPGTIIDAFSAGVPVIATDWNCISEIIDNGINGIIYPKDNIKSLKEAIINLINDETLLNKMRYECIKKANEYNPEYWINEIIYDLEY